GGPRAVRSSPSAPAGARWGGDARGGARQFRGPPVVAPAQDDDRRDEQGSDEEGVEQYAEGDRGAQFLDLGGGAGQAGYAEGGGQDQPGRGHGGTSVVHGIGDRLTQRRLARFFADAAHDQDVVVLTERHQEHKQQERQHEV